MEMKSEMRDQCYPDATFRFNLHYEFLFFNLFLKLLDRGRLIYLFKKFLV